MGFSFRTASKFVAGSLFQPVFVLICLLSIATTAKSEEPADSSSGWGARAEWHRAQTILVHTPGPELWAGVAHPWSALFEHPFDPHQAAKEHDDMVEAMAKGCGLFNRPEVQIHNLVDVLTRRASTEQMLALADRFVTYDFKAIRNETRRECEENRAKDLKRRLATTTELRPVLINAAIQNMKIFVSLDPGSTELPRSPSPFLFSESSCGDRGGYDLKAEYLTQPLMNLYFTRDQMITTGKGVVLTRPKRDVRQPEVEILKIALEALGVPILAAVRAPGTLEGGDFLPAGDVVYIGQGDRTNMEAIRQLMAADVFGSRFVAVVKDPKQTQQEMHLDTYFNIIGPQLVVLTEDRIKSSGSCEKCPAVDVYQRQQNGGYRQIARDVDFSTFLRSSRQTIVPVSTADQEAYGTNFLTIEDKRICAVKGISEGYLRRLRETGTIVELIDLDHLKRGYGAAHCTTQVLKRQPS